MATYNDDKSYASSGVGTAGLTLGVIGTALASGILGNGSIGGLFGGRSSSAQDEICQLRTQNAILASENSTDKKLVDVYTTLRVADKAQDEKISALASRVLAIETSSPLKEQIFDGKIAQVYDKITCCCNASNTAMAGLQAEIVALQNLTKTVIPITNVCPQPMPLYNSWTAPTTPTTANSGNA